MAESRFIFQSSCSATAQHHTQSTRKKTATRNWGAGIRDQFDNTEANFFGHLHGLTFMMKLEGVITLGGLERGAEKDKPIVS
jgi:hypothetical protein